jgi:hypothetical protein
MEFFHGIVALLAFVVLVLAGMVAWLYMQQTRLLQAVNALAIAISTPPPMLAPEPSKAIEEMPVREEEGPAAQEEDDRVSVYEEEEDDASTSVGEETGGEEVPEIVDYTKKTMADLRDLLTKKGIPFNKSDKKTTLVSLIQATA